MSEVVGVVRTHFFFSCALCHSDPFLENVFDQPHHREQPCLTHTFFRYALVSGFGRIDVGWLVGTRSLFKKKPGSHPAGGLDGSRAPCASWDGEGLRDCPNTVLA